MFEKMLKRIKFTSKQERVFVFLSVCQCVSGYVCVRACVCIQVFTRLTTPVVLAWSQVLCCVDSPFATIPTQPRRFWCVQTETKTKKFHCMFHLVCLVLTCFRLVWLSLFNLFLLFQLPKYFYIGVHFHITK